MPAKMFTVIIIMKNSIAAGKKAMLNTGGRTMIDIVTGRSATIIATPIAAQRRARI
ncbi:MAG: hypothetical protein P8X85_18545 [Desulfobacterales bacterium]